LTDFRTRCARSTAPCAQPIDLSLAWLPFEREALEAADHLDLRGVDVPVARAEDLVIYKAAAFRDRDRSDIERLLRLYGASMDLARVRAVVAQFAEALEQPERVAEFDSLLKRSIRS
jgi:predicted nucleotidyltransferase